VAGRRFSACVATLLTRSHLVLLPFSCRGRSANRPGCPRVGTQPLEEVLRGAALPPLDPPCTVDQSSRRLRRATDENPLPPPEHALHTGPARGLRVLLARFRAASKESGAFAPIIGSRARRTPRVLTEEDFLNRQDPDSHSLRGAASKGNGLEFESAHAALAHSEARQKAAPRRCGHASACLRRR